MNLYYFIWIYRQSLKRLSLPSARTPFVFIFFIFWGPEEGYRKFWSTRSRRAGNLLFIALDCKVAQGIVLNTGQGGGERRFSFKSEPW